MNRKMQFLMSAVVGLLLVQPGVAKDVFWEGTNGTWKVGGGGWMLEDGTPTTFEEGDNVTFGTANTGTVSVKLVGDLVVGDITFNATNHYNLNVDVCGMVGSTHTRSGMIVSANHIYKYGTGNVKGENLTGSWDCDLTIYEGYINLGYRNTNSQTYGRGICAELLPDSLLGDLSKPHTIQIGSTDTPWTKVPQLSLYTYNWGPDPYRGYNLTIPTNAPAFTLVVDGGQFGPPSGHTVVGDVVLKNGGRMGVPNIGGTIYYNGNLRIARRDDNQPSVAPRFFDWGGQSFSCFGNATGELLDIYVEEVTATADENGDVVDDGVTDFYLNSVLSDTIQYKDNWRQTSWPLVRSGWVKRGPGTMNLGIDVSNANRTHGSIHSGDQFILEGKVINSIPVIWESGCFGHPDIPHTVYVGEGTTLQLCQGSYRANNHCSPEITTVVSNATLRLTGSNNMGNLELYGSAQLEGFGGQQFGAYSRFELDEPLVIDSPNQDIRLSCATRPGTNTVVDAETSVVTETKYGYSELDVRKCVNHAEGQFTDLSINLKLRNHTSTDSATRPQRLNWKCGLIKTGDGVLDIGFSGNNNPHSYTWETLVEEGGILFQGIINNGATVKNGAVVGGKGVGKIQGDLTIEEGGGLLVDALDTEAQVAVGGTLTMPRAGLVKLYNVTESDVMSMKFENLPLPNAPTVEGYEEIVGDEWKVEVDGMDAQETKNLKVSFNLLDSTYSIGYKIQGLTVVIR